MSKITNRKTIQRFARWHLQSGKKRILNSAATLEHQMLVSAAPFAYRAPHANRPTAPRHKYE